jgi:hypothetical protein
MKQRRLALAAWLVAMPIVASLPASAQPETEQQVQERLAEPNYGRGGYYIGLEGLVAVENSSQISGSAVLVSGGFDVRLGARHNRWFATELSGLYVHTYGDGTGRYLAWGMTVNERFYFTKARVQPFILVGGGFLQVEARNRSIEDLLPGEIDLAPGFSPGFAAVFGLGMEIYATEDIAVTVMGNYHLTVGNISGFDFVTAGIGMVFF